MIKSIHNLRKAISALTAVGWCLLGFILPTLGMPDETQSGLVDTPSDTESPNVAAPLTDKKLIVSNEGKEERKRSPLFYTGLSIVPGLGQAAQGNYLEGLGYFSTVFLGSLIPNRDTRNIATFIWSYNLYDAYRDAGAKDTSNENILENYSATFNPLNILDPLSAAGVAGGFSMALIHKTERNESYRLKDSILEPIRMGFVGLGEEALFRGFMFPAISHLTTSYWTGAIASSALFSAYHFTGWGLEAFRPDFFTVRFLGGLLGCWQTYRNQFDLRKSIFTHAWFDVFYFYDSNGILNVLGPSQDVSSKAKEKLAIGLKFNIPIE